MVFNRFRWVFCQLEMLRNCLPQNVRRVLQRTARILGRDIRAHAERNREGQPDQAYRLLQCLTVATRPLRVEELAEILALDFDETEEGIPVLNEDWRWDDEQQGVLATCSSLIVVVDSTTTFWRTTRVVQFAHFSVKEFLTSDRLATLKQTSPAFISFSNQHTPSSPKLAWRFFSSRITMIGPTVPLLYLRMLLSTG